MDDGKVFCIECDDEILDGKEAANMAARYIVWNVLMASFLCVAVVRK